jgi:arylsulfatase A-like enzyme
MLPDRVLSVVSRIVLVGLAGGLLLADVGSVLAQPNGEDDGRPNIVFIFSDDHAVQALGAYDGRLSHLDPTPEIDRLAEEGMLFRNAFVTNSICAPSRATILSGQHSHMNGVRTNGRADSLEAAVQTFPELLQDAGYQTAMVGKWHLKSDPQGFDYWEVLPGQGVYYNPTFLRPADTTQYTGYVSEVITDRAVRWLREGRSDEDPFLLMYQHKAPHRNWQPGPEHLTTYDDVKVPAPRTLFYDYSGLSAPATMQEMEISTDLRWGWDLKLRTAPETGDSTAWQERLADRFTPEQRAAWNEAYGPKNASFREAYRNGELQGRDLTRWKYQRYIKDYLRSIRSMDDQIGRLLDALDRQGVSDNTIVVYASDQGFFLGEKGWFDKRWMYEESLRMPLLVRWPGVVESGAESEALVQNLDLAQTFLEAAGVEAPEDMQGRSLAPLLRGTRPDGWRESIYYHYYEYPAVHSVMRHEGVRTGRYKLINHYWADQWALFDLRKDPRELNNVYGDPDYADVTERLKRELERLKTQYEVPESATEAGPSRSEP